MLSFVVPAYNEEHELPRTIRAILRATADCGSPIEIVVVDDASTDGTSAVAMREGARVISVSKRQIAAVRNAGAKEAHGDILFFVDADTQIAPVHVTAALRAIASGYVGGGARIQMDDAIPPFARIVARFFCAAYAGLKLGAGAFLFTTADNFQRCGGFDEQYFAGEEIYFTQALKKLGRFIVLREPVLTSARKVRMHSPGKLLLGSLGIVLRGPKAVKSRDRLGIWYDGKREQPPMT